MSRTAPRSPPRMSADRRRLARTVVVDLPGVGMPLAIVPADAQELLSRYMDSLGPASHAPRRVLALSITWRVLANGQGAGEHFAICLFSDGKVEERKLPADVGAMLHIFLWCKTPTRAECDAGIRAQLDHLYAAVRTERSALVALRSQLATAEHAALTWRNEVEVLRARLAERDQRDDAELGRLRGEVEHRRNEGFRYAEEIGQLRARVTTLQGQLDAARQVGVVPTARPAFARQTSAPAAAGPSPASAPPPPAAPAHSPESTRFALLEID